MTRRITIRGIVKELFEDDDLIISYVELPEGGFDLSVRYVDNILKAGMESPKNYE